MMTVRYPNGVATRFNDANYIVWAVSVNSFHKLHTKRPATDDNFIAIVPGTCSIEWQAPCAVLNQVGSVDEALDLLESTDLRRLSWRQTSKLADLKLRLASLNRQTMRWR